MLNFRVGQIYLSCGNHPVLCIQIDDESDVATDGSGIYEGYGLWGISLLDGTSPHGCSVRHCAPVRLTLKQALAIKSFVETTGYKRDATGYYGVIGNIPDEVLKYEDCKRILMVDHIGGT